VALLRLLARQPEQAEGRHLLLALPVSETVNIRPVMQVGSVTITPKPTRYVHRLVCWLRGHVWKKYAVERVIFDECKRCNTVRVENPEQ
jgi:hypothetical protein